MSDESADRDAGDRSGTEGGASSGDGSGSNAASGEWSAGWESAADRTTTDRRTVEDGADVENEEDSEPSLAGVFGARPEDAPPRPEIAPESPSLENALFLLLGVLLGVVVIYRAVVVFTA